MSTTVNLGERLLQSFHGKLRDELLDREIFDTLLEGTVSINRSRVEYNTARPHRSLGYRPPGYR